MSKPLSIQEHFGLGKSNLKSDLGIEIETESSRRYEYPSTKFWRLTGDGSLRIYGVEWVSRPLKTTQVGEALEDFKSSWEGCGASFVETVYSSVHVHLNVKNLTPTEFANVYTAFLLFEEILAYYCGPQRDGNLFALKTSQSNGTLIRVKSAFQDFYDRLRNSSVSPQYFGFSLSRDRFKYGGLNLTRMSDLGTMEVRYHGGTVDIGEIQRWVDVLVSIRDWALTKETPFDIVQEYEHKSAGEIVEEVLKENFVHFQFPNLESKFRDGLGNAVGLARTFPAKKDWLIVSPSFKSEEKEEEKEPQNEQRDDGDAAALANDLLPYRSANMQYEEWVRLGQRLNNVDWTAMTTAPIRQTINIERPRMYVLDDTVTEDLPDTELDE